MCNMNLFFFFSPCSPQGTLPVRNESAELFSGELHVDLFFHSEENLSDVGECILHRHTRWQQNYLIFMQGGNIQNGRRLLSHGALGRTPSPDIVPVLPFKDVREDQSVAKTPSGPVCAEAVEGDQHGHAVEWCLDPPRASSALLGTILSTEK